jgi:hypothetical protein
VTWRGVSDVHDDAYAAVLVLCTACGGGGGALRPARWLSWQCRQHRYGCVDTVRSCWRRSRVGVVLYALLVVVWIARLIAVSIVCHPPHTEKYPTARLMENSGNSGECCRGVHVRGFVRMDECGSGACCRVRRWTVRHLWAYAIATCLPFFFSLLMSLHASQLPCCRRVCVLVTLSVCFICSVVSVLQLLLQMQLAPELEMEPQRWQRCVRSAC